MPYPIHHESEGPLCHANGPHTVVYAAGTQSPLSDLKPSALTQQQVVRWHTHILKQHLGMAI